VRSLIKFFVLCSSARSLCGVLQRVAVCVLQCCAMWFSVLQCGAVQCSVIQCVVLCSSTRSLRGVLQCVAVFVTVWCSVVQYVAV